jgi:hypothetical protein
MNRASTSQSVFYLSPLFLPYFSTPLESAIFVSRYYNATTKCCTAHYKIYCKLMCYSLNTRWPVILASFANTTPFTATIYATVYNLIAVGPEGL